MTTTTYDLASVLFRGIRYLPAKPVAPVRPVTGCDNCDRGCECEGGVEGVGCSHWSCWGRGATDDCPIGTEALREHMHASTEYRNALHAYYVNGGV